LGREFKAIFFDLDGTLVDIHGPLYIAACNALDQLGYRPPLTRDGYHQAIARDDVWLGVPEYQRPDYLKLALPTWSPSLIAPKGWKCCLMCWKRWRS
jgi:FMN phosphatase YigB (HAD superfamily)